DEPVPPQVNIGSASIREGDTKTRLVKLTVTLTKPSAQTVTVNYSTPPGSASSTSDYVPKLGVLTFKPRQISKVVAVVVKGGTLSFTATAVMKTVTVSVKSEFVAEPDETFTLALSNEVGSATLTKPTGTATIINDD